MRRRVAAIVVTVLGFATAMWVVSLGGVACTARATQPFALLAAAPQAARVANQSLPLGAGAPARGAGTAEAQSSGGAKEPPLTVLSEGNPTLNEIALTFDDGPHPGFTEPLLRILAEHKIRATFFIVGKMAEVAGDLVQREAAEGHEIGNHTYSHVCLKTAAADVANEELRRCNAVVETLTNRRVGICRPPGGVFNRDAIRGVRQLNMMTVLWTCDPADYEDISGKEIVDRTLPTLTPGGIVLLHDGIQGTLDALPWIISACETRGFKFVTCSEMAQHRANRR